MFEDIKEVIFGYKDNETANKLREFYLKHTGRDIDFNNIKQYKDGFKLIKFSIPLKDISEISITEASHYKAKKFSSLDEFIKWYEKEYLVLIDYEIIKHIPHSSLEFPEEYDIKARLLTFGRNYIQDNLKMCDLYVDELFKDIEGVEVKAKYTRLYCDVEKFKDDRLEEMAKYGHGYIYTKGLNGKDYFRHRKINNIDLDSGVDEYYDNHHQTLLNEVRKILAKGKKVLILDLHSFSDEQALSLGEKGPFPDICIGGDYLISDMDVIDLVTTKAKERGYTVGANYPFKGSIYPLGLSKEEKENVKSVMIEVNKRIYL